MHFLTRAVCEGLQTVEAVKLFDYITESGLTPDQRSFELMIFAHIVNRDVQSASDILSTMVSAFQHMLLNSSIVESSIGKRMC